MKEKNFWQLIKKLDWNKSGDDEAVVEPVISELSKLSEGDICEFENILSQKLYDLDTKEHAKEIGEDAYTSDTKHFSADWFLYARCVVVANGESLYKKVKKKPKSFPKDMEFEALLYIAQAAFERKTGKEYTHIPKVSFETFSNEKGWE